MRREDVKEVQNAKNGSELPFTQAFADNREHISADRITRGEDLERGDSGQTQLM